MSKKLIFVFLYLVFSFALFAASGPNLTYEVKFLLNSEKTVNSEGGLAADVSTLFNVSKTQKRTVVYAETADKAFIRTGWINRVREKDGKKNLEITYKKRYAVAGTDVEGAMALALREYPAFSAGTSFEAQVDWNWNSMTLSFDTGKKFSKPNGGLRGMSTDEVLALVIGSMPDGEKKAIGRAVSPSVMKTTGCIDYVQYSGTYNKTEVDIEIWNLPGGPVAELSFKAKTFDGASAIREELTGLLDSGGLLLHQDSLKTSMILNSVF